MNSLIQFGKFLFLALIGFVFCGCAPTLQMTIEHRDGAGNLINRYTLKPSDTKDVEIQNIQASHKFNAFVDAEYSDGLQEAYIVVDGTCSGTGVTSSFGYSIPVTGNAVPPNQNPTKISFSGPIGTTCNRPNMRLTATAVAVGAPTKTSGTSTVRTRSLILIK